MFDFGEYIATDEQLEQMLLELDEFSQLDFTVPHGDPAVFQRRIRQAQMNFAYVALTKLFKQFPDVRVTIANGPGKGMGYVSVEGPRIPTANPRLFRMALSYAHNVEVYPKFGGTLCMNLTFYGI